MKKIEVFFSTALGKDKLEKQLYPAGACSLSLVEVRVPNRGRAKREKYRGVERTIRYYANIKAEIITADENLEQITEILAGMAKDAGEQPKAFISDLTDHAVPGNYL